MRFNSLQDWLAWQETLHPSEIELGLDRIASVFKRLHNQPYLPILITVAGTNGKGSSVAMLDAIYRAAGYKVGKYTSPHIVRYNERIAINGEAVSDIEICEAFERIDQARKEISLTYFEFGTLAALDVFLRHELDVVILEVGLGGRLDAVNIVDADVALITAISQDHIQWLGNDTSGIAKEKAGIMRRGKPVVSSGFNETETLKVCAEETGAELYQSGENFSHSKQDTTGWQWQYQHQLRSALPMPALRGQHQLDNAAGVLMVIELLSGRLPVSQQAIRQGLISVSLPGRFQVLTGDPVLIFDVAHNVDALKKLSEQLKDFPCRGRTFAVLGMLSDKDIKSSVAEIRNRIDEWFVAPLATPRTASTQELDSILRTLDSAVVSHTCHSVTEALSKARQQAGAGDCIVVFGSFYTVAEVMPQTL